MTYDSRRYHRPRRPTFARGYGAIGGLLGLGGETAGAGAATGAEAATAAGAGAGGGLGSTILTGLEHAAGPGLTGLGKAAVGGIESLGQGLQSLFTGGGGEAGKLAALGQTVPEGVDLVGPSSTFTGPGFLHGVYQGFIGAPEKLANPSAATQIGTGVGQLMDALQKLQQQGGGPAKMPPPVNLGPAMRPPQVIPSAPAVVSTGPIMSLLKPIGSL